MTIGNYKLEVFTAVTEEALEEKMKKFFLQKVISTLISFHKEANAFANLNFEDLIGMSDEEVNKKLGLELSTSDDETSAFMWFGEELVFEFIEPTFTKAEGGRVRAFFIYRELESAEQNNTQEA